MTLSGLYLSDPDWDKAAVRGVIDLGNGLARTVCIARALVDHGRKIDLGGLEHGVGLFCAKALDLCQEQGKAVRPHMIALLDEIDRLAASIRTAEGRKTKS